MKKQCIVKIVVLGMLLITFLLLAITLSACTPGFVKTVNGYEESLLKANDDSSYYTKKEVENSCRAMIASYESDKLTYEQYKDSENEEKQSWAEQAKMRANNTASTYNNYMLKNSYVWENNIPSDIKAELEFIE